MAKFHECLDGKLTAFIQAQPMFFIASAAAEGRVNLSPKGLDAFRVLGPMRCAYLDFTGSGNETSAHAEAGGRATVMFCSFTRNPLVLRLFGKTIIARPGGALFEENIGAFDPAPGVRQIIVIEIDSVQTACGFGVPLMALEAPRTTLTDHWSAKGEAETAEYRNRKNLVSIDGLPTGWPDAPA